MAPQASIMGEESKITNRATAKVREEEERGLVVSWRASHADWTNVT
jgi:hypothetical protein